MQLMTQTEFKSAVMMRPLNSIQRARSRLEPDAGLVHRDAHVTNYVSLSNALDTTLITIQQYVHPSVAHQIFTHRLLTVEKSETPHTSSPALDQILKYDVALCGDHSLFVEKLMLINCFCSERRATFVHTMFPKFFFTSCVSGIT